jgi:hypothetical protein
MRTENFISLNTLCKHYHIEMTLFNDLKNHGLIDIMMIEESNCISLETVKAVEKMIRLQQN